MPAAVAATAETAPLNCAGNSWKIPFYQALLIKSELWSERRHKVPAGP